MGSALVTVNLKGSTSLLPIASPITKPCSIYTKSLNSLAQESRGIRGKVISLSFKYLKYSASSLIH
jgi:hypothetical protein